MSSTSSSASRPYPSPSERSQSLSATGYGDLYGLLGIFLDFEHRDHLPSEIFEAIGEYRDSRPPTRYAITTRDLCREYGFDSSRLPHKISRFFLACGCWTLDETDDKGGQLYANPNYVHDSRLQIEVDDRIEMAKQLTKYGTIPLETLAKMEGVPKNTIRKYFSRNGFDWRGRRYKGRTKMARTIYTNAEWHDGPNREVYARYATGLGRSWSTIEDWIRERDIHKEFEPPADPSGKPWYA